MADAPDDADPDWLRQLAATQADAMRQRLTPARQIPAIDEFLGVTTELDELRFHLHDTTLQVLEYIACGGYGLCASVDEIRAVATRAAHDLASWLLEEPVADAHARVAEVIGEILAETEPSGGPLVRVSIAPDIPDIDLGVARALQGAVREALTNVRKHAHARTVRLVVAHADDRIIVTVADDGEGFDESAALGLGVPYSICGRLARVGGEAEVTSSRLGTEVRLRVRAAE